MSTTFENTLDDVLRTSAAAINRWGSVSAAIVETRLPLEEELATIEAAQAGDEDSLITLMYAYGPALANGIRAHQARLGEEEARSVAVMGLIEAVQAFDATRGDRLAGIVAQHITKALRAVATAPTSMPDWAQYAYLTLMKRYDNDPVEAEKHAPTDFEMSRAVFRAVRDGLSRSEGLMVAGVTPDPQLDGARPLWADDRAEVETGVIRDILVGEAFKAVNTVERDVIEYVYGFVTGEPLSDGAAAYAISLRDLGQDAVDEKQSTISRAAAQRHHQKGLVKMRKALSEG